MAKKQPLKSEIVRLKLADIKRDKRFQVRVLGTQAEVVDEYREVVREKREFRELMVVYRIKKSGEQFLTHGFHRYEAYEKEGVEFVEVELRDGTLEDALIDSCAYIDPGFRRSNDDKRKSVLNLVAIKPEWSNADIARHCGVSHTFVNKIRPTKSKEKTETGKPKSKAEASQDTASDHREAARTDENIKKTPQNSNDRSRGEEQGKKNEHCSDEGVQSSVNEPVVTSPPSERPTGVETDRPAAPLGEVELPPDLASIQNILDLTPEQLERLGFAAQKTVTERVKPDVERERFALMLRRLIAIEEMMSWVLSGAFAEDLKPHMTQSVTKWYREDDRQVKLGWLGNRLLGFPRYTCDAIVALISQFQALKMLMERAQEKELTRTEDTTDPWALGNELRDDAITI